MTCEFPSWSSVAAGVEILFEVDASVPSPTQIALRMRQDEQKVVNTILPPELATIVCQYDPTPIIEFVAWCALIMMRLGIRGLSMGKAVWAVMLVFNENKVPLLQCSDVIDGAISLFHFQDMNESGYGWAQALSSVNKALKMIQRAPNQRGPGEFRFLAWHLYKLLNKLMPTYFDSDSDTVGPSDREEDDEEKKVEPRLKKHKKN